MVGEVRVGAPLGTDDPEPALSVES
ncbi:Protein of unknown function [Propionibacterium freudenreichii]|nr:Protein of unknown function [Propionibacterium freudenreichii]